MHLRHPPLPVGPSVANCALLCAQRVDARRSQRSLRTSCAQAVTVPIVPTELHESSAQHLQPGQAHKGTPADIIKLWRKFYKEKGWSKYAPFNGKGGFNTPYVLFKAKNITDAETRAHKWKKVRPISPGTKHPMRRRFLRFCLGALDGLGGREYHDLGFRPKVKRLRSASRCMGSCAC